MVAGVVSPRVSVVLVVRRCQTRCRYRVRGAMHPLSASTSDRVWAGGGGTGLAFEVARRGLSSSVLSALSRSQERLPQDQRPSGARPVLPAGPCRGHRLGSLLRLVALGVPWPQRGRMQGSARGDPFGIGAGQLQQLGRIHGRRAMHTRRQVCTFPKKRC